jgi:hypothetical protein
MTWHAYALSLTMGGMKKKMPACPPAISIPARRFGGCGNIREEAAKDVSGCPVASASAASSTASLSSAAWYSQMEHAFLVK